MFMTFSSTLCIVDVKVYKLVFIIENLSTIIVSRDLHVIKPITCTYLISNCEMFFINIYYYDSETRVVTRQRSSPNNCVV